LHCEIYTALAITDFVGIDRQRLEEFVQGNGLLKDSKVLYPLLNTTILKYLLERMFVAT
jgi:hypothetical protein